jgi:hypothetical protein
MTEINIYPRQKELEHLLELYPPQAANKFLPEWYKKQKSNSKESFYSDGKDIQAKRCPAIVEELTRGIVIPSWSDIYITKKGDEYFWQLSIGKRNELADLSWIEHQGFNQITGMNLNSIEGYGILKLISPYLFSTPKGHGLYFKDPFYHHRKNIRLLSGYVETDIWHEVNFPFEFLVDISKTDNSFLHIKAGEPLLVIDTYNKNNTNELIINKYDENFIQEQIKKGQHLYSISEDWKRYSKFYK